MNSQEAILDFRPCLAADRLAPPEMFLVASILQSLAQRHIYSVQTAVDTSQVEMIPLLKSLHFREAQRGAVWSRELRSG